MDQDDHVYVKLQQHLNNQAVGFPATRSGAEIRILKHIFSPKEAEISSYLSYKPEPIEKIFEKTKHLVQSLENLEAHLDSILRKGGIEFNIKNGKRHYCCAPLVVGMFEFQLNRLTPEFVKDFKEYTSEKRFGIEFLSTELPQMRTIPIARSIQPKHNVSTYDEVTSLLKQSDGPFVIVECICRKMKSMEAKPCKVTDRKETCLAIGTISQCALAIGAGREISREEAISILEQNQKDGLVLQPSNTEKVDFICSCCGCCCGLLRIQKTLPKPLDYWSSNFFATVDTESCIGCGACTDRCQVKAVFLTENQQKAVVDLDRCIGCGLCVTRCPTESISLEKRPIEKRPPKTREDLYDIIMANKKGKFGKLKLTGKLVLDAVKTGRTELLK